MNSLEVTSSDSLLFSPENNQSFVALQNNSDSDVFLSFDGTSPVTVESGWKLAPGESLMLSGPAARLGIRGIHAGTSGSKFINIQAA